MNRRIICLALMLALLACLLAGCVESDKSKYESAQSLMAREKYAEAAAKFDELGSYEEAAKLAMYCKAAAAGENGDYDTAFSTFRLLGDYKESAFMITYYEARQCESKAASGSVGNWLSAARLYDSIALFRDSRARAEQCRKAAADFAAAAREKVGKTSVATGIFHTVGLKADGTVVAVGDNNYGQCDVQGWTDIQVL